MKNITITISAILALFLFITADVNAQKASPPAEVTAKVGDATITINYSQPGVKGRTIYGGLVPYDNVWRTGANEATAFETTGDIVVGGKKLAAGKYGIWTIPGEDEWTWIFSSSWDTWGTNYDPTKDVIRIKGTFEDASESMERMTFKIEDGTVSLHWADKVASFSIAK